MHELHRAVSSGSLETVQSLISEGYNVNDTDEKGYSVFYYAFPHKTFSSAILNDSGLTWENLQNQKFTYLWNAGARPTQTESVKLLQRVVELNAADRSEYLIFIAENFVPLNLNASLSQEHFQYIIQILNNPTLFNINAVPNNDACIRVISCIEFNYDTVSKLELKLALLEKITKKSEDDYRDILVLLSKLLSACRPEGPARHNDDWLGTLSHDAINRFELLADKFVQYAYDSGNINSLYAANSWKIGLLQHRGDYSAVKKIIADYLSIAAKQEQGAPILDLENICITWRSICIEKSPEWSLADFAIRCLNPPLRDFNHNNVGKELRLLYSEACKSKDFRPESLAATLSNLMQIMLLHHDHHRYNCVINDYLNIESNRNQFELLLVDLHELECTLQTFTQDNPSTMIAVVLKIKQLEQLVNSQTKIIEELSARVQQLEARGPVTAGFGLFDSMEQDEHNLLVTGSISSPSPTYPGSS